MRAQRQRDMNRQKSVKSRRAAAVLENYSKSKSWCKKDHEEQMGKVLPGGVFEKAGAD